MTKAAIIVRRLENAEDSHAAFCCQTEVLSPWPQAVCQCRNWIAANLGQFVEGFHVEGDGGIVVGHLYYAMSERALVPYELDDGVGVIYCEWIQQRHQKQGLRKLLFDTFLEEMQRVSAKGILVESTDIEGQMHYRHYLQLGFEIAHEADHQRLLYLPLTQPNISVRSLTSSISPRKGTPVEVLILNGYLCPFEVSTRELLLEITQEFGHQVVVHEVQLTPATLKEYGVAKGIFINGQQKLAGGETEEAIRQAIVEEF